jgi:hypothetical protein
MNKDRLTLDCTCCDSRHLVRIVSFPEKENRFISIETQLIKAPFFKRLKLAFSYLFNIDQPHDSLWSETLLGETEVKSLNALLKAFLKGNKETNFKDNVKELMKK